MQPEKQQGQHKTPLKIGIEVSQVRMQVLQPAVSGNLFAIVQVNIVVFACSPHSSHSSI